MTKTRQDWPAWRDPEDHEPSEMRVFFSVFPDVTPIWGLEASDEEA